MLACIASNAEGAATIIFAIYHEQMIAPPGGAHVRCLQNGVGPEMVALSHIGGAWGLGAYTVFGSFGLRRSKNKATGS